MRVLQLILELIAVSGNLVYWWWVATRGEKRFRAYCERRYRVTITPAGKGGWRVAGEGSWFRRGAIGWLQLGYFMAAFLVWGIAMIGIVAAESLLG